MERHIATIAECIIFCAKNMITPLYLGLAASLHHLYGSRHLIDLLYNLGLSIYYNEFMRFNTSIALNQVDISQASIYIPPGIILCDKGGAFIQEASDNIDHNAKTLDGKHTLHAMATVVFQRQTKSQRVEAEKQEGILPRTERSLDLTDDATSTLSSCLEYTKPTKSPEPPKRQSALDEIEYLLIRNTDIVGKNFTWVYLRNVSRSIMAASTGIQDKQIIPCWSGYNYLLAENVNSVSAIGFKPIILNTSRIPHSLHYHEAKPRNVQKPKTAIWGTNIRAIAILYSPKD